MSTDRALAREPAYDGSPAAIVRELLKLLVKTQKAQRLYEARNAISNRLEDELFSRLTRFLDEEGELYLVVQEFALSCDDEVVYRGEDRTDSLAFLLFRDGIRRLSFHRGLAADELHAFLSCLNRVAVHGSDQDDLVTLLWEQELHAIRYFAIEELAQSDAFPRLADQLAADDSGGGTAGGGGGGADSVSLDLEQPVTTVPVEACRLGDDEIEALQAELHQEERVPFHQTVSELALELTLLEDGPQERAELVHQVLGIADRLVVNGDLNELVGLEEHLCGLATMVFASEPAVQNLASELRNALAAPARVDRLLERVEALRVPRPEVLTAYLARLGSGVTATLVPWTGRLSSPAYRRAVTNAILVSERGIEAIERDLPVGSSPSDSRDALHHRQLVREVLYALSQHPGERALAPLERLVAAEDPQTRRESFIALSRYPEPRVEELCLDRLNDPDPEIRATALDTLVRRGRAENGPDILDRTLSDPQLETRPLSEKRRVFAAVAKLGGEDVLSTFRRLLLRKDRGWFTSTRERQLFEAVAHGVRMVGTRDAEALLRHLAEHGARFARAACHKELEKIGRRVS